MDGLLFLVFGERVLLADPADPGAMLDVTGTFDFAGTSFAFGLRGTITFSQTGSSVDVTDTTYSNSPDRALMGTGTLVGNTLAIMLVPQNGDTDYEAEITFRFGDGGDTFWVAFSDTNNDVGSLGSYIGRRR